MEWLRRRWEIAKKISERRWVRWAIALYGLVAAYDLFLSQFVPESLAKKFPKMHELIVATSGWLPLSQWLMILVGIIAIACFEYAVRRAAPKTAFASAGLTTWAERSRLELHTLANLSQGKPWNAPLDAQRLRFFKDAVSDGRLKAVELKGDPNQMTLIDREEFRRYARKTGRVDFLNVVKEWDRLHPVLPRMELSAAITDTDEGAYPAKYLQVGVAAVGNVLGCEVMLRNVFRVNNRLVITTYSQPLNAGWSGISNRTVDINDGQEKRANLFSVSYIASDGEWRLRPRTEHEDSGLAKAVWTPGVYRFAVQASSKTTAPEEKIFELRWDGTLQSVRFYEMQ